MVKIIGVIGSGSGALGFLEETAQQIAQRKIKVGEIDEIHIFDSSAMLGSGMPYDQSVTEAEHLLNANIFAENLKWAKEPANQEYIKWIFKNIFRTRLKEKFTKRFGKEYNIAEVRTYSKEEQEFCTYYNGLYETFCKRYLDFEKQQLRPRILYGIFAVSLFERACADLEDKGIKIVRHPKSEVVALTRDADRKFAIDCGSDKIAADNVIVASGSWHDAAPLSSNRHIAKIWPSAQMKIKKSP